MKSDSSQPPALVSVSGNKVGAAGLNAGKGSGPRAPSYVPDSENGHLLRTREEELEHENMLRTQEAVRGHQHFLWKGAEREHQHWLRTQVGSFKADTPLEGISTL